MLSLVLATLIQVRPQSPGAEQHGRPCYKAIQRSSAPRSHALFSHGVGFPDVAAAHSASSSLLSHVRKELLGASRPTRAAGLSLGAGCSQRERLGQSHSCRRRIASSLEGQAGYAPPPAALKQLA